MHQKQKNQTHQPVLLQETLRYLAPQKGERYLDVTAGFGGHAQAVLRQTRSAERAVLVDRDAESIEALRQLFGKSGAEVFHKDFLSASRMLAGQGKEFDMILADLGVSSPHLNQAGRGFAFSKAGPLDMRMDQSQALSAETIVNTYSEARLTDILANFGQEPKAGQIARRIIAARPIKATDELAKVVAKAWPGRSKVHPATRTFQALRIAVNSELEQLEQALPLWLELLAPGGRLVTISFHSLEDRIVKQFFTEHAADTYDAQLILLTKKPVQAGNDELVSNPRARSAKLRAAAKIKTKRKE